MSLTSRLGFGLALGLIAGFSTPMVAPAILSNSSPKNSFTSSFAQTQTAQAQTAQAQTAAFSDVSTDYWAHDYIEGLAKSSVISGFPDGTFRPNEPVTRAQFAAILRQSFSQSQPTTAQSFKDVPANYWAANAISAARSGGFLSGYPDNTFKPNDRIVRVQALVSLANGLQYPAGDLQSLSNYKDADTVPAYALPSTAAAAQANLVVSYPAPDQISPNRAASRAEVAAFVYQALVKAGRVDPIAAKPERRWQTTPITTIADSTYLISLSKNGQRLAAITDLGPKIQIWNTQTGALLRTFMAEEPDSYFSAVAISQDGTKIAAIKRLFPIGTQQLTVQAVEDGRVLLTKSLSPPQSQFPKAYYLTEPSMSDVVFTPDGKQVVTKVRRETQRDLYDTIYNRLDFHAIASGEVTQSINLTGTQGIERIGHRFSPDGRLLARLRDNDINFNGPTTVDIWQLNNNNRFDYLTALPIAKGGFSVSDMAFTDSNLLNIVTVKNYETRFNTWNPQTAEQVQSTVLPYEECMSNVLLSPNGTGYYSSNYNNGTSCLGNTQTGEFQRNIDGLSVGFEASFFSGDGNSIAVAGDRQIRIFTKAAP